MGHHFDYIEADEAWKERIAREWDEMSARHMRLADGFSLLALHDGKPVGLIAVYWRELPQPLSGAHEGFINIIGVLPEYKRQGIATRLIELSTERARQHGAYQLRAWSSEDKTEAIPMWKTLGFGLCPATVYPGGHEVNGYFVARVL